MAARDLKAMMAKGNEIPPAESREEFLEMKAKEQIVDNITPELQSQSITTKSFIRPTIPVKQTNNDYTKKGYYFLSEANYWYLKDISQFYTITVQDYLNALIELDKHINASILPKLYHNEYYTKKND